MLQTRRVTLIGGRALSSTVRELRLRSEEGHPWPFRAGQWINVHLDTPLGRMTRAYSIASPPGGADPAAFDIAVTRVADGPVSTVLHDVPTGAVLDVDGPHGFFTHDEGSPSVFVGTGTGLAPLRSMIGDELAKDAGFSGTLLFGCRATADILWRDELSAWADRHPGFRFEVTLSRPDAGWAGRSGYVQDHLTDIITAYARPHVYICGLSKMVGEVRQILKTRLGFDRKHIHSERYD
jgi:CDP-4-dehydro-6-deoxyglucose reductase, E3